MAVRQILTSLAACVLCGIISLAPTQAAPKKDAAKEAAKPAPSAAAAAAGGALTRGKYAPSLQGVDEKHIYEAMETGPQNMPVFSDSNIKPEDKRDIIAYLKTIENQGSPGGLALGSLGPVSEGLFIWTIGLMIIIGFTVWLTTRSA